MTPKEKANELVELMLGDNNHYMNKYIEIDKIHAKKCALITIDEILSIGIDANKFDYWKEVEQEIENL